MNNNTIILNQWLSGHFEEPNETTAAF